MHWYLHRSRIAWAALSMTTHMQQLCTRTINSITSFAVYLFSLCFSLLGFLGVSVFLYMVQLYGFLLPHELRSLEIMFYKILRRIWSLPRMYHTCILHRVGQLDSMHIQDNCHLKLLSSALKSQSNLICDIIILPVFNLSLF